MPINFTLIYFAIRVSRPMETHLRNLSAQLSDVNIAHTWIVESDAPYSGQMMSIGLELVLSAIWSLAALVAVLAALLAERHDDRGQ